MPKHPSDSDAGAGGPRPLRFGILGAAAIGPLGLIIPARTHPEVVVHAVAARSRARAETYAAKHGIAKAYEGYQGACGTVHMPWEMT